MHLTAPPAPATINHHSRCHPSDSWRSPLQPRSFHPGGPAGRSIPTTTTRNNPITQYGFFFRDGIHRSIAHTDARTDGHPRDRRATSRVTYRRLDRCVAVCSYCCAIANRSVSRAGAICARSLAWKSAVSVGVPPWSWTNRVPLRRSILVNPRRRLNTYVRPSKSLLCARLSTRFAVVTSSRAIACYCCSFLGSRPPVGSWSSRNQARLALQRTAQTKLASGLVLRLAAAALSRVSTSSHRVSACPISGRLRGVA